jgi:hypothetical protein
VKHYNYGPSGNEGPRHRIVRKIEKFSKISGSHDTDYEKCYLQGFDAVQSALKMEAADSTETLARFYQTILRHILEDGLFFSVTLVVKNKCCLPSKHQTVRQPTLNVI